MTPPPTETMRLLTRARDALNEFARAPGTFGGTYCKICCAYEHTPNCIVSQLDFALAAPPDSYVKNCEIHPRAGDGPIFVAIDGAVLARLDGYRIAPKELAAPPANVEKMRAALAQLPRAALDATGGAGLVARPLSEWHEDMGDVLWWTFPVVEPPYAGMPIDTDWRGYHTHWTPLVLPTPPAEPRSGLERAEGDVTIECPSCHGQWHEPPQQYKCWNCGEVTAIAALRARSQEASSPDDTALKGPDHAD